MQQSLHVLHHPEVARRPGIPARRRRAARGRDAWSQPGSRNSWSISQDTSAYGVDIKYAPSLWKDREVAGAVSRSRGALGELGVWVRLHYVYPYPHVDEVIPLMAEGKVLPYLDVPFQHASPERARRMNRPAAQEKTLERIRRWRDICPDLTIRSTFIVGFPGETEEEFQILLDWLDEAAARPGRLLPLRAGQARPRQRSRPSRCRHEVKEERWHRLMKRISRRSRRGGCKRRSAPASR